MIEWVGVALVIVLLAIPFGLLLLSEAHRTTHRDRKRKRLKP